MVEHKKTHCKRGHEFTPENTYTDTKGKWKCRACGRLSKGYKGPKTHCKNGHEFTSKNTYIAPSGSRSCRICRLAAVQSNYDRNQPKIRARVKANRDVTPDSPEIRRKRNLRYIGWSPELFVERLNEQEGKCSICKKILTFEMKISNTRACADHKHSVPPKPRGILCVNCNLGIGNLQDNPEIMRAAIAYVEKWTED